MNKLTEKFLGYDDASQLEEMEALDTATVICECGAILPYSLTTAIEKFINQKDVVDKDIDVLILKHALVDAKNCPNCDKYYAKADFSI